MNRDAEKDANPKIKIKGSAKGYGSIGEVGKALALANPALKLGNSFGEAADKLYMTPDLCLINLTRRVRNCEAAAARGSWFGGRLYNRLSGDCRKYAELSGAVLVGALKYIGDDVPDKFDRGLDYLVRRDVAQDILRRFTEMAREQGLIK